MCPKAYEPSQLPYKPNRRAVRLITGVVSGELAGKFGFAFSGSAVQFAADANSMNGEECTKILEQMSSFGQATCERESAADDGTGSYVITIDSFPLAPHENNIFSHTGNPPVSAFKCNMTETFNLGAISPYCSITDVETEDLPPYMECGGHGTCDSITGDCSCQRGFHGLACDDTTDNADVFTRSHDGPFFTGSLVKLAVTKPKSSDFSFLRVMGTGTGKNEESVNITTIQGDGRLVNEAEIESKSGIVSKMALKVSSSGKAVVGKPHFLALLDEEEVFSVANSGDITAAGSLLVANNTFLVEEHKVTMSNAAVEGNLAVDGHLHVTNMTIGSEYRIGSTGMSIDIPSETGTILQLAALDKKFDGTVLDLQVASPDSSILKASVNGQTRLEITGSGIIEAAGMRMRSGGLEVDTGGAHIKGGGLTVAGGLTVQSGGISMPNQAFSSMQIEATNEGMSVDASRKSSKPLLRARNVISDFDGALLDLESESNQSFSFIRAGSGKSNAFSVAQDGSIASTGGLLLQEGLTVGAATSLKGGVNVNKVSIKAGEEITIPENAAYVEILDDGKIAANKMTFEVSTESGAVRAGQIVVISNKDEGTIDYVGIGACKIEPGMIIMFIYDGFKWKSVDSLYAPTPVLKDVTSLTAVNDLDVGNFTFSAEHFRSTSLPAGHIVLTGADGLLTHAPALLWSKGVLSVPAMKLNKLLVDLDVRGNIVKNAILTDSKITADEFHLNGVVGGGIAMFDASGALGSDARMQMDADGGLKVKKGFFGEALVETNLAVTEGLTVGGTMSVGNALTGNSAEFTSMAISGEFTVAGDVSVGGFKADSAAISGALTVDAVSISTALKVSAGASISESLFVGEKLTVGTNIACEGLSATKDVSVTGKVVAENMHVKQNVQVDGDVTSASATFKTLKVGGTTFDGEIKGTSASFTSLKVGATTVDGDIKATSASFNTLKVGATTFDDDQLTVTGATATGSLVATGSVSAGSLRISGDVSTGSLTLPSVSTAEAAQEGALVVNNAGLVSMHSYQTLADIVAPLLVNKKPDDISYRNVDVTSMLRMQNFTSAAGAVGELRATSLVVSADSELHGDVFMSSSLTVQGTVVGSGPYVDSSDARFKKNIKPLEQALDKVCALRGVSYDLRLDEFPHKNFGNDTQIGWIAQEVEKIAPELVVEDAEGYKAVAYARSTALLGSAIAELRAEMSAEMTALKEQITALKAELANLKKV